MPPLVTAAQPTLEQLTAAINQNSQKIRNFSAPNASIYAPGVLIPLHSRLFFERPKRLRLQGSATALTGQEYDFGSNDTLFWIWMRKLTGEMWYCRHDQYPACPVRSKIPIDPDWLIDALGLAEFKPSDLHSGPNRLADGNWEILSRCQTASGQFVKRTVIDSKTGCILRQELYTPQNKLIAFAAASDLRFDRGTGIYYARKIEIQCEGTEGKMVIDLGTPVFNSETPFAQTTFEMPVFSGYQAVDLCSPEFLQPRGAVMPPPIPLPAGTPVPQAGIQTIIR
jgi:hypothetical protein